MASVRSWEKLSSSHTTFLINRGPDCAEVRLTVVARRGEKQLVRLLSRFPLQMFQLQKPKQMKKKYLLKK